ncbi:hypothetical protein WR25_21739 [Diploscapter pachys]|uniref:Uncharacterized protein n=1 Tax=Diploscapter pachys TaxID=2018661 RepID=A0A2A2JYM0_9BILA|nr:hypothetical protein WR25_21739 [Diploscapter pachys]
MRGAEHLVGQRRHAIVGHILRGARHADRGNDAAAGIADRGGDAADLVFVFLKVERAAAADVTAHARQPQVVIGRVMIGLEMRLPLPLGIVEHQRLAEAGRGHRLAVADAAADLDATAAGNLVEIEGAVMIADAEVHRILRRGGQRLDMVACDLNDVGLLLCEEAEFEQLRPQAIALARREGEEATVDQRAGETVRRAARQAEPAGEFGERDRTIGDGVDQVEPPQQRLAAGGGLCLAGIGWGGLGGGCGHGRALLRRERPASSCHNMGLFARRIGRCRAIKRGISDRSAAKTERVRTMHRGRR